MSQTGMTQYLLTLVVSFFTDFMISGGSAYTAAMVGAGSTQVPTRAALILALVTGLIAGARRLQALMAPPPLPPNGKIVGEARGIGPAPTFHP